MSLEITILGCGSSGGVPRIGNHWGACDPDNPRNRRRRCSILATRRSGEERTDLLIDTPPDMREQLLDIGVGWLDGVLYTHEHADHCHGIDDLRMIALNGRRRVRIHGNRQTMAMLRTRFDYCFRTPPGSQYPPILDGTLIRPLESVTVGGAGGSITALPFDQLHGDINALGFRFGNVAYSADINGLPDESIGALEGLDVWIVDALRRTPHPSHFSLDDALEWIGRIGPKRAILTNMHVDLDYATLVSELPDHIEPAYDGMTVTVES